MERLSVIWMVLVVISFEAARLGVSFMIYEWEIWLVGGSWDGVEEAVKITAARAMMTNVGVIFVRKMWVVY